MFCLYTRHLRPLNKQEKNNDVCVYNVIYQQTKYVLYISFTTRKKQLLKHFKLVVANDTDECIVLRLAILNVCLLKSERERGEERHDTVANNHWSIRLQLHIFMVSCNRRRSAKTKYSENARSHLLLLFI